MGRETALRRRCRRGGSWSHGMTYQTRELEVRSTQWKRDRRREDWDESWKTTWSDEEIEGCKSKFQVQARCAPPPLLPPPPLPPSSPPLLISIPKRMNLWVFVAPFVNTCFFLLQSNVFCYAEGPQTNSTSHRRRRWSSMS